MAKKGLLLLNIGSPSSYSEKDVAIYLKKFLMDERIIDIPFIARWILVNWLIVPRRAAFSAENYKRVWFENEGSPLLVYSQKFAQALKKALGADFEIEIGMRYSEPSAERALKNLEQKNVESYIVVPMFPQYAEATTGSALLDVQESFKKLNVQKPVRYIESFATDDFYVDSVAEVAQKSLPSLLDYFVVFSFHGLPERQIRKSTGCKPDGSCEQKPHERCYLADSLRSARAVAGKLGLRENQWKVTFQSRLGKEKWLEPATDNTLAMLPRQGIKKVAILSPAFVADCIETLEELGIGGKEIFLENGGEDFQLIPCLNDSPGWVERFSEFLKR